MPLDVTTLFIVATCVTALLGLFLLALWLQDRTVRALGWWAAAYIIGGTAVALWLIGPLLSERVSEVVAPALLFVCCGMIWTGARNFHGRPALPFVATAGALAWLLFGTWIDLQTHNDLRVVVSSLIIATYAMLTAIELKRERRKPKWASRRAYALAILHGTLFLSPIATMHFMPGDLRGLNQGTFALFALLTLLYVVGTAFIVVVMAKEQSVLVHKTAAMTDPLTGLFNRRGYEEAAQKLMIRQIASAEPVTVLMFDLDHFKSINDRYGHDAGDAMLRDFATTMNRSMRADDIVARLGGEEFSAILAGGLEAAMVVAERVRAAFERASIQVAGCPVATTVSIGAFSGPPGLYSLTELRARADAALYRAKQEGRNRIVGEAAIPGGLGTIVATSAPSRAPAGPTRCATAG
ncbi:MAG: GGDEF domain-containing protein [Pseudorhodoplanes sp.]|nr:hypothetical protein [Pseudorhodoplanes sp.]MCL4712954.1 GGDEF domain-containing protein [Pseudorhodoplanes sp.]